MNIFKSTQRICDNHCPSEDIADFNNLIGKLEPLTLKTLFYFMLKDLCFHKHTLNFGFSVSIECLRPWRSISTTKVQRMSKGETNCLKMFCFNTSSIYGKLLQRLIKSIGQMKEYKLIKYFNYSLRT